MSIRDLSILIIRLFAIVLLINTIIQIPGFISFYRVQGSWLMASGFVSFIIAVILWFFSDIIADRVISGNDSSDKVFHFTLSEVQILAISLIGLVLLTRAIPEFISKIILYSRFQMKGFDNSPGDILQLLEPVLKVAIGFFLLLGPRGIQGFINKMREAGLPKIDD